MKKNYLYKEQFILYLWNIFHSYLIVTPKLCDFHTLFTLSKHASLFSLIIDLSKCKCVFVWNIFFSRLEWCKTQPCVYICIYTRMYISMIPFERTSNQIKFQSLYPNRVTENLGHCNKKIY